MDHEFTVKLCIKAADEDQARKVMSEAMQGLEDARDSGELPAFDAWFEDSSFSQRA